MLKIAVFELIPLNNSMKNTGKDKLEFILLQHNYHSAYQYHITILFFEVKDNCMFFFPSLNIDSKLNKTLINSLDMLLHSIDIIQYLLIFNLSQKFFFIIVEKMMRYYKKILIA
jgi:hypothetical protein